MIDFFMGELGFSPFMGLFKSQSPVFAAIKQKNLNMFKYFVDDTKYYCQKVYTFDNKNEIDKSKLNKYRVDEIALT